MIQYHLMGKEENHIHLQLISRNSLRTSEDLSSEGQGQPPVTVQMKMKKRQFVSTSFTAYVVKRLSSEQCQG